MHFRDEISLKERTQLRFCKDWLEFHRKKVEEIFPLNAIESELEKNISVVQVTLPDTVVATTVEEFVNQQVSSSLEQTDDALAEIRPLDEELPPDDSRYAPLALYLLNKSSDVEGELLAFEDIEEIIRNKLPASARKHRAWWSNHLESNPQARQWWNAGWRVSYVDMEKETVLFTRNHERARKYNGFFSMLHTELSQVAKFPLRKYSAHGRHWMTVSQVPGPAVLGFSFARRGRFRVELYIDTGDKEKNKHIFDALFIHKDEIQNELEGVPGSLEWERIGDKRASRIAIYNEGTITDTDEDLGRLRTQAVDTMIKFQKVMNKHLSEVL